LQVAVATEVKIHRLYKQL